MQATTIDWQGLCSCILAQDIGGNANFQMEGILSDFKITTTVIPVRATGLEVRGVYHTDIERSVVA